MAAAAVLGEDPGTERGVLRDVVAMRPAAQEHQREQDRRDDGCLGMWHDVRLPSR